MRYKLVNWTFDYSLWAAAIDRAATEIGQKELAAMLDVNPTTIRNWRIGRWTEDFTWPAMHNLLKVVNLLDLDPREMFTLEDK